jgi:hypothetical protein
MFCTQVWQDKPIRTRRRNTDYVRARGPCDSPPAATGYLSRLDVRRDSLLLR